MNLRRFLQLGAVAAGTLAFAFSVHFVLFTYEPAPWVRVAERAGWSPRDSAGALVHDDALWLLGGWESSEKPAPRDVWTTTDGANWSLLQPRAEWQHGDFPLTVSHAGTMWLMGGWKDGRLDTASASSEVWNSPDGRKWELVTRSPGWSPRFASGVVSFKGRIWIFGGASRYFDAGPEDLHNDIWSSEDGKSWQQVLARAPWNPRAFHAAVVHQGRIWVIGGGNYAHAYLAYNDIWSSDDGETWVEEGEAPWAPRIWFSAASLDGFIWVLGGYTRADGNLPGVWLSRDGKSWFQFCSVQQWSPRHAHSVWTHGGKLWLAGGHANPLNSEVWMLDTSRWATKLALWRREALVRLGIASHACV